MPKEVVMELQAVEVVEVGEEKEPEVVKELGLERVDLPKTI